ncbi:MAG: CRISPR-associated endonuclease Cas2 [Patescibacteria group bacterium]
MKKYKKGEIAEIILSVLLATGVVAVAIMAPNALQIFKYFKPQNAYERARIKRSVALLERRKFIKKKEGGAGGYFTLTAAGKIRAMRRKIETMKIAPQKNWDGKWRIVMFDISEEKKMARRAVNHALKKLGCVQYQKSVFIIPFPCKTEIDFVGECFGVRNSIRLVLAEHIEGENNLKKIFKV